MTEESSTLDDIEWHNETRLIGDLKDHEKNPRVLTKDQMKQLKASFKKFGYCEVVAINLDNTILAGHQRTRTMKILKMDKKPIDVRVPNRMLTPEECDEYLIRSNKNTGEWDYDMLANQWDVDKLIDWGFTEEELSYKNPTNVEAEDDGFEEELPPEPFTKPGDIYDLGRHRIICGSATNHDDILKLCDDESVDLVLTDPPYNVAYTGGTAEKLTIKNDNMSAEDFSELLRDFYVNAYLCLKPGGGIYVFHADSEGEKFRKYFRESGLKMTQCLIWLKNSLVLGRQDYQWQHEPCLFGGKEYTDHDPVLYGWREGDKHKWYNNRKQTTLLKFDRPTRNKEHPTMKPIPMLGYLINNSTKPNDCVIDFFLGSGSTLIACEQVGRRCVGSELDPKYCDVIVDRYMAYKKSKGEVIEMKLNGVAWNGERKTDKDSPEKMEADQES